MYVYVATTPPSNWLVSAPYIYVCVCVYVCMYVCICCYNSSKQLPGIYIHTDGTGAPLLRPYIRCAYIHTHTHTYIHKFKCRCTHTHANTCIHTYTHTDGTRAPLIGSYIRRAYIHTYIHTHTHTYIRLNVDVHIHTQTHAYIHTHTQTVRGHRLLDPTYDAHTYSLIYPFFEPPDPDTICRVKLHGDMVCMYVCMYVCMHVSVV